MSLTREEVAHIAELAKLALTEEEIAVYSAQLSAILDYAAMLQHLDTEAIPPTASVLPLRNVMAADVSQPCMDREYALLNAPDSQDGYFKVKPVLE